jgi:hypothetical protein
VAGSRVAGISGGWWWLASQGYWIFVVVAEFFIDLWTLLLLDCLQIYGFYIC